MRFYSLSLFVTILFGAAAASPASADTITYTYNTTTAGGGFDGDGDFGLKFYPIPAGLPAVVSFTVDLGKGTPVYNPNFATYLTAGPTLDVSQLNVWASITINGQTRTPANILSPYYGTSSYGETRVGGVLVAQTFNVRTVNYLQEETSSFSFQYIGSSIGMIGFGEGINFHEEGTGVDLYPTTPVITVTGTTPEPASILLLGTGLVGVAGLVRRRFVSNHPSNWA